MAPPNKIEELAKPLRDATQALTPGDFETATKLLSDPLWDSLEAHYWNASHPLPVGARRLSQAYCPAIVVALGLLLGPGPPETVSVICWVIATLVPDGGLTLITVPGGWSDGFFFGSRVVT